MRENLDGNQAAGRTVGSWSGWRERVSAWMPSHIPIAYKFAGAITTLVVAGMALLAFRALDGVRTTA